MLNNKMLKNLKFYEKNGYLILNNVISKKNLKLISKELEQEALKQKNNNAKGLSEPGVKKSLVHSLHLNPKIKKICEEQDWFQNYSKKLLKSKEIAVWNAKSNLKRRWHGSVEYYHQDFEYWSGYGFKSSNMMSCMIFVDDHKHLNGGMWIFKGSHKYRYKHEKFMNINLLQKNLIPMKILDKLSKKYEPISLNIKAGSCLFFHCKLIHGSAHNISPYDRRMILYQMSRKQDYNAEHIGKVNFKNQLKRRKFEKKSILKTLRDYN